MTEPSSSTPSPVISLVLRLLTLISILISLIILTTNSATIVVNSTELKLRFKDVHAYRYMLFALVVGLPYTLLQIVFGIYHVSMGKRISSSGESLLQFDFYADKVMSYILATGTGAAFGATLDLKEVFSELGSNYNNFFNKGSAAASFILFAFLFTAVSSVFSSLALPKKL
ncbi:CASP-like protein 4D1 [Vitis riparia]|uniref:CASP-like protein 4D1 n=1 Tax=Vitis riparia TaxID=96939 RepID=UPI00155ADE44|nr:CASP-like protein 4D1 [Vitis riparia]